MSENGVFESIRHNLLKNCKTIFFDQDGISISPEKVNSYWIRNIPKVLMTGNNEIRLRGSYKFKELMYNYGYNSFSFSHDRTNRCGFFQFLKQIKLINYLLNIRKSVPFDIERRGHVVNIRYRKEERDKGLAAIRECPLIKSGKYMARCAGRTSVDILPKDIHTNNYGKVAVIQRELKNEDDKIVIYICDQSYNEHSWDYRAIFPKNCFVKIVFR